MGAFQVQNPGIGGLDELTDSEALFVQQMVSATKTNGDVLTISGGLPTWGAGGGGGTKSILLSTLSANQSSNLTASNHVEFDTSTFSQGSSISVSTGVGQANGTFTLATGKTYRLRAGVSIRYTNSTDSMRFSWRNVSGATNIGIENIQFPTTWAGQSETGVAETVAYITTSASTQIVLYINSATGSPVRINGGTALGSFAEITEM